MTAHVKSGDGSSQAADVDHPRDAVLVRLVHDLADAFVIADNGGKIVLWNRAAEQLFGWRADEALGRTLDLIIPERLQSRHWEGYHRSMASGTSRYGEQLLEVPAVHRDGHTISIAFTVTFVWQLGQPQPVGVAAVIRDDTARWHERRELKERLADWIDSQGRSSG